MSLVAVRRREEAQAEGGVFNIGCESDWTCESYWLAKNLWKLVEERSQWTVSKKEPSEWMVVWIPKRNEWSRSSFARLYIGSRDKGWLRFALHDDGFLKLVER